MLFCSFLPLWRLISMPPPPGGKFLLYLWSHSADTICLGSLLMPGKMTSQIPLLHCQITAREPHKGENTKSHSANTVSGDTLHLFSPGEKRRGPNTRGCPENWKEERNRKVFHISSRVSKCQRSISWNQAIGEGLQCNWTSSFGRVLWTAFFFKYISFRFLSAPPLEVPQMGKHRIEYAGSESSWKRVDVYSRLRRLFSHLFERMISHLHTIRKTLCSLWPGVISGVDIRWRRRLVSLINNNSSCLAVATGQDWWGDFDQSFELSWEDIAAVCSSRRRSLPSWISLPENTLVWDGASAADWGNAFSVLPSILIWRGKDAVWTCPASLFGQMITCRRNLSNLRAGLGIIARKWEALWQFIVKYNKQAHRNGCESHAFTNVTSLKLYKMEEWCFRGTSCFHSYSGFITAVESASASTWRVVVSTTLFITR